MVIHMSRSLDQVKLYKIVGERIRMCRRSLTPLVHQKDVADISDGKISRSSVANMEGGRQAISLHQLYRIADILRVEPSVLLPPRDDVFEGAIKSIEDEGKREWLSRILHDEPKTNKRGK